MTYVLVHGLGQDSSSWKSVTGHLSEEVEIPDLFDLLKGEDYRYQELYESFCKYLDNFSGTLDICGLSLGGLLALDYTKNHPDKVRSLILIGTPHRIPKLLYFIQGIIFHLMPNNAFKELGVSKKEFIKLSNSMTSLDIMNDVDKIKCKTLLICGSKDKADKPSLEPLHNAIKDSEVKIVEGAGHTVNEDKPEKLAQLISSWWA